MVLEVVVISRETIKPSLPTPQHLKNFQLSQIDQYTPPNLVPIILFYPAKTNTDALVKAKSFNRLKTSLSETLSRFYPLSGRIIDNQLLECNDNGVDYFETQVRGELNQVLSCPKVEDLTQLLPDDICAPTIGSKPLVVIQVHAFDCGGLAIAICISHKIADAATMCTFVNSWAKTAYGSSEKVVFPKFDSASLFPPKQVSLLVVPPNGAPINKVVSKRFIFDSTKISELKSKAASTLYVENPTRVEAIGGLIWRCALKNSKDGVGFKTPSQVFFPMNLRRKLIPPLPDHSFGNLLMSGITSLTSESETDLHSLVGKMRDAKRKLEEDYMKKLPLDDVLALCVDLVRDAHMQYAKGEVELYTFTSWCRFPFYEADFGWGKPIWANCPNSLVKNVVFLMDTKEGDGIEAWVTLDEQDMERFECEKELLAYASPNP